MPKKNSPEFQGTANNSSQNTIGCVVSDFDNHSITLDANWRFPENCPYISLVNILGSLIATMRPPFGFSSVEKSTAPTTGRLPTHVSLTGSGGGSSIENPSVSHQDLGVVHAIPACPSKQYGLIADAQLRWSSVTPCVRKPPSLLIPYGLVKSLIMGRRGSLRGS